VDPYMRGRMRENNDVKYADGFKKGEPLTSHAVAKVLESKNPGFAPGDIAVGMFPWVLHQTIVPSARNFIMKVSAIPGVPVSAFIGVLGMPGLTSYFGLLDITHPKEGETVLVSGAAGAVGSIVGQIAKIKGCKTIGIAGSEEKIRLLKDKYGYDEVINYNTYPDFPTMREAIHKVAPNGVDVYFDNTGGSISDAALLNMNNFGRVSVCGAISSYNEKDLMKVQGPRTDFILVVKQIKKEGFLVHRWAHRAQEGLSQMGAWIQEGKIKFDETIVEGFDNAGQAFIDMLAGKNIGKMVVKC